MSKPSVSPVLRPGDWVQVRSAEEILATLDDRGELAGLPFMPEMLAHAGQIFQVQRRAEAACASQEETAIRRLTDTVHLDGLRCDGSYHGQCQSSCLLFWKEAWLEPASPPASAARPRAEQPVRQTHGLLPIFEKWTTQSSGLPEGQCYQCQATQLWQASKPLSAWDLRQYVREVQTNGTSVQRVTHSVAGCISRKMRQRLERQPQRVPVGQRTPVKELNLQVGELVEVRAMAQIAATLDTNDKNRGLWFDPQMAQYCGRRFRVACRIERIINEGTGRMIELKSPVVSLETVCCDGCWHRFCSREAQLFWREIWLKRVDSPKNSPTALHP